MEKKEKGYDLTEPGLHRCSNTDKNINRKN